MERSVCAHMTRFSLTPMYDWVLVLVGSFLCMCLCGCACPCRCVRFRGNVWQDSSVQGYVRGGLQIEVELMKTTCHIFLAVEQGQEMKLGSSG